MDKKETIYIDKLFIYTLWYELSNNFGAQSYFGKIFVTKNLLPCNILTLGMI